MLVLALKAPALWERLSSPAQVQQEEAVNLEFGRMVLAGQSIYPDIRQNGPYIHPSYPPLYPTLLSFFMRFVPGPWWPGRLPAFIGYLACGILLAGYGWRRWGPAIALSMAGLLWLFPTWRTWGSMARMDTLLSMVDFLAFLWVLNLSERPIKKRGRIEWGWWTAGFLNAAALAMKPSACTVTLAVFFFLLSEKRFRELMVFLSAALIPVAILSVYFQCATHGLYLMHTLKWAATGFDWRFLWTELAGPFFKEAFWLIVAGLFFLFFKPMTGILKWQMLFSALWIFALCREGSAENYYMEFLLYGLFWLGEGWSSHQVFPPRIRPFLITAPLLGLLCLAFLPGPRIPSEEEITQKDQILPLYAAPGESLSLDTDLPYLAGKGMEYQYSGLMPMAREGLWDPAPLIQDIRNHKFTTIELYDIPEQFLLPQTVAQAVEQNYHVTLKAYGRRWYLPNQD
jgi:hypothetical protein